jgi:thioredoxin-related protein
MKFRIFILFSLILSFQAFAQKGIQFDEAPFADILAKAKKENKMVFMDAYTTWCGPCKMLVRNTFPDSAVGAFFNQYFISTSKDMERGEGTALARKYSVQAYPTLLFLDGDGNVIHRDAGYLNPEGFLALGKIAANNDNNLSSLEKRFSSGDRSPDFLFKYMQVRFKMADNSHDPVAQAFLQTQSDWRAQVASTSIMNFVENPSSAPFQFLLKNKNYFAEKFGTDAIMGKIEHVVSGELNSGNFNTSVGQMDTILNEVYPEQSKRLSSAYSITHAFKHNDTKAYIAAADRYLQEFPPEDVAVYDDIALRLVRFAPTRKMTKQAEKWIKIANIKEEIYENYLTLAQIYEIRNKKSCLRKAATKAIALGTAAKQDVSAATRLLEKN